MKILRKFFTRGSDVQVHADIEFRIKAKDSKKWNEYQRHNALKFLEQIETDIKKLKQEIQ